MLEQTFTLNRKKRQRGWLHHFLDSYAAVKCILILVIKVIQVQFRLLKYFSLTLYNVIRTSFVKSAIIIFEVLILN